MEALLSVSPWRELFWLAIGGLFFSLLCLSGALLRSALWPPPRAGRRPAAAAATRATAGAAAASDDLETIEGIGPAIGALLRANGIRTFIELAGRRPAQLRRILERDPALACAEPASWPLQARLLAEGRYGDFVRLIAVLKGGAPTLENVDGLEACCAARLRAGGICTIAELQRCSVAQVVGCFAQNDRAQIHRLAPRWIEHAGLLHEGDEAALCALAGIACVGGPVRAEARRTVVRSAAATDTIVEDGGLAAYWQRESRLQLLCPPLGALALLLFLLLLALLGALPSPRNPGGGVYIRGANGGTTISMIQNAGQPNGPYGPGGFFGLYGPYGPYGPYPPYPAPNPTDSSSNSSADASSNSSADASSNSSSNASGNISGNPSTRPPSYPRPYPYPYPYPPYPYPAYPYPPYPYSPYPPYYPQQPGSCCPNCPQSQCPPPPAPPHRPRPHPAPQPCACDVCGCEVETDGE